MMVSSRFCRGTRSGANHVQVLALLGVGQRSAFIHCDDFSDGVSVVKTLIKSSLVLGNFNDFIVVSSRPVYREVLLLEASWK